ncbi:MAG: hypothetical protein KC656_06425 [Myxococcales bacterium]|nr:hypothetical protein [Myxococcales bacterium]
MADVGNIAGPGDLHPDRFPDTFDWPEVVDWLVRRNGSLAATAELLAAQRRHRENVDSIERALRRLRTATGDGGTWGARVIEAFGLPDDVRARLAWMGTYHSRFTDLPTPVCADLLRFWDRPAIRRSAEAVWLDLGRTGLHLRRRETEAAAALLEQVDGPRLPPEARVEAALVGSFLVSRSDPDRSASLLDEAETHLSTLDPSDDRACLHARWVDQVAYRLNLPRDRTPDYTAAEALYRTIDQGGPPFARCRRHNGLGWSLHRQGRRAEALAEARASVQVAGDAGHLRLRAMALGLLAKVAEGGEAESAAARGREIAARLADDLLTARF